MCSVAWRRPVGGGDRSRARGDSTPVARVLEWVQRVQIFAVGVQIPRFFGWRANAAVFFHTHAGRLFLRRLSCTVHALYRFPVPAHGFPVRWWSGCRALAQARLCRAGGLCPARPGPRRGTVAARPDFQCKKAVAPWYQNPPCRAVRKPWYALGLWGGSPDHLYIG